MASGLPRSGVAGDVAAAGLAEVALVAPYRAVLDERRPGPPLAAHLDRPCPPDPAVEPSYPYHPSVLPDAPEGREREEELQEALDAAQATPEEGGPAAGHLPWPPARGFFSAGRRWCAVSHMPVETAQCRARAMTRSRR